MVLNLIRYYEFVIVKNVECDNKWLRVIMMFFFLILCIYRSLNMERFNDVLRWWLIIIIMRGIGIWGCLGLYM